MNILPISKNGYYYKNSQNNNSFKGNRAITQKYLLELEKSKNLKKASEYNPMQYIYNKFDCTLDTLSNVINAHGILSCKCNNGYIKLNANYNEGMYIIKPRHFIQNDRTAKEYIAMFLHNNSEQLLGGLTNYINLIKDTKRQDLFMKAFDISTFIMNSELSEKDIKISASLFSRILKKHVSKNELFSIEEQAYFYNADDKKVYSINANEQKLKRAKDSLKICEFIKDKDKNVIGYNIEELDFYQGKRIKRNYQEQQVPSQKLPSIVDVRNNKLLAESFRFGNTEPNYELKKATPAIQFHLSKKTGNNNISEDKLQYTTFLNSNNKETTRICYYDPTIGCSFVHNKYGEFLYMLDYELDNLGNILSFNKL